MASFLFLVKELILVYCLWEPSASKRIPERRVKNLESQGLVVSVCCVATEVLIEEE